MSMSEGYHPEGQELTVKMSKEIAKSVFNKSGIALDVSMHASCKCKAEDNIVSSWASPR